MTNLILTTIIISLGLFGQTRMEHIDETIRVQPAPFNAEATARLNADRKLKWSIGTWY